MPLVHEFGAKILEIITGVADPLNAPILGRTDSEPRVYGSDGDYGILGLANGYNLRGFPFADQPSKASFRDFFKSIDALFNLGFWYDGTEFVIAEKETFYRDDSIITLGEVKDLEITIAKDKYFNKVLGGYAPFAPYEDVNGQQVPNVQAEYANDGQRVKGELDIRSPFRADDYGIELSRKEGYYATKGEDTKFDSDVFFINSQRDSPYRTLQGYDNFDDIDNIFTPETRLNLDLTPKRNLARHLNQLAVPVFLSGSDVQFISTQYNLPLETKKTSVPTVVETEGIDNGDLVEPLFYPEEYNFTAPLTGVIIQQLRTDPHGYVEFDADGVTYAGFILEVSTEPFMRKGNWTLIKRNPNR